jgi:hypothetical protein
MMAGRARYIIGAGKNRIEEEQAPEFDSLVVAGRQRIVCAQDHLRELTHQSAAARTNTGCSSVTNEVRLYRPEPERDECGKQ